MTASDAIHHEETLSVEIDGLGWNGEGFARLDDGTIVSVPHTLPGDRVRVRLGERVRRRAWGEVVGWSERSREQRDPLCHHYDDCAGCALRHVSPDYERDVKLTAAREILSKFGPPASGDRDGDALEFIGASTRLGHRRRGRFRVAREPAGLSLGLGALPGRGSIADIRDCPAQSEPFRRLMTALGRALEGAGEDADAIQSVEACVSEGEAPDLMVLGVVRPLSQALSRRLAELANRLEVSMAVMGDDDEMTVIRGRPVVRLSLPLGRGGGRVPVEAPWPSWIHPNDAMGLCLGDWVERQVGRLGPTRVLDLCAGLGSLTFRVAPYADEVIAVDTDRPALQALERAARGVGGGNVAVRPGRVGTILRKLRGELPPQRRPELAIINPMRRPLGRELDALGSLGVRHAIYCGPSPASAAKDAARLAGQGFRVEARAVVDLHPGTARFMLALVLSRG